MIQKKKITAEKGRTLSFSFFFLFNLEKKNNLKALIIILVEHKI